MSKEPELGSPEPTPELEPEDIPSTDADIDQAAAEPDLQEVPAPEAIDVTVSREWSEKDWRNFLETLVQQGLLTWEQAAAVVLGEMNPPQVGTSLASVNKQIKATYGKGKVWQAVKEWLYSQPLGCRFCGTLLTLEVGHVVPREVLGLEKADNLDNMRLVCKRCNAKQRPSHKEAGKTHLSAAAALMWILLHFRPATYADFKQLCRDYGLTMADIRFQEAWALAEWLKARKQYP